MASVHALTGSRRWIIGGVALLLAVVSPLVAAAQTTAMTDAYRVDTGHTFVDAALTDINHYVERHPDAFLDELEWYAGAARAPMAAWLARPGQQGADLYFGCQLAALLERSCARVMADFVEAGEGGWSSVLAGLTPPLERSQWAALETRIRASYRRWERPLPVVTRKRG